MREKSKLLFLICAFMLTFAFVLNVKAEEVTCNGSKWTSGSWSSYSSGMSISGTTTAPSCSTTGNSYTQYEVKEPGNNVCGSNISSGCHRSRTWTKTTTEKTCGAGQYVNPSSSTGCSQCPSNQWNPANNTRSSCQTCDAGYKVNSDQSGCEAETTTGVCCCTTNKSTCSWLSSCTSSQPSPITGATKDDCKDNEVPTTEYKCYCNPINSRCEWRNTNANNWVPVEGITDSGQCTQYSTEGSTGCFTNGTEYKWRTAGEGWTYVSGISTKDACESMHYEDPTSGRYSLTCPATQIKVGETINCTYTTNTNSPLKSAKTTSSAISASVSGKYIAVTGVKLGAGGVSGVAEDGNSTNNIQIAVVENYTSDTCSVSVSTGSSHTSQPGSDNVDNDYYIVNVNVVGGSACDGTITYHASNAKSITPTSATLLNSAASRSLSFKVYPIACKQSRAYATISLKSGGSVSSNYTTYVTTMNDWRSSKVCEKNPTYTDFQSADAAGSNVYYSNYGKCDDGTNGYTLKWTRGGCGGGTSEQDKCYKDKSTGLFVCGKYASLTSRYTFIDNDCNSDKCKNPEQPKKACYKNKETGKYKFDLKTNLPEPDKWVYVDLDEEHCKDTEETPACYYIEETGKYDWGLFDNVAGYVKTELTKEQCVNLVGCYKKTSDGSYHWGEYEGKDGYELVASITDETKCKVACFKCDDDEYKWGGYDQYSGTCELVPNITTEDSCKPVPVTGATASKIIYALSLFLVMAGSGIIVYQLTKTKKELM